ncbi:MAG: hypothetical protein P4M12_02115 [Gammaproteobacteria bacterium]|nr:hypothetical protein [Gammaproteobacteria bacterium]
MASPEPLCNLLGVNSKKLTREENFILEAELYSRICEEIKDIYKVEHKNYFRILKMNAEMEKAMIESNFIRCVINDILATKEYTLSGIACYTKIPEDILYEIATGSNEYPILDLSRRVIELHRSVRADLYRNVVKKNIVEDLEST